MKKKNRRKKIIIAVILVVCVAIVFGISAHKDKGIDVSQYQGDIQWEKVDADFVMVRCAYRDSTNGSLHIDDKFYNNMNGATKAKIPVGIYVFSQAINDWEAVTEAQTAISLASQYDLDLPIAFDMEKVDGGRTCSLSKDTKTKLAIAFCKVIEEAGYEPMIYGSSGYFKYEVDFEQLKNYKIWLADYNSKPTIDIDYDIWQYSSKGKIPGIKHKVDLNVLP